MRRGHMLAFSPIFLGAFLYNTLCSKHKDMEFPRWAGAALVMTDKGVIGRRTITRLENQRWLGAAGRAIDDKPGFAPYDTAQVY